MSEPKDSIAQEQTNEAAELENQFVLSLPTVPAASLRAAVRSGVMNLKDRLKIDLEPDMRHAKVNFDKWTLKGKVMDLPSIIESYKTLDCKTFYKTADICQILICKEEEEAPQIEEEENPKKKDTKDKRFMLPHGITPPLKNVRKRRFRKTLKKKYVDFPDIEKEVKRLFKTDNEAISVRFEVINADDDKGDGDEKQDDNNVLAVEGPATEPSNLDVAEYDIFGEVLSSSDGEVNIDEELENSETDSKINGQKSHLMTEFSKSMLGSPQIEANDNPEYTADVTVYQLESAVAEENLDQILKEHKTDEEKTALLEKLDELEHEIADILARRRAQELEIMSIENQALKQRFQSIIDNLKQQEYDKQKEYDDIVTILHQN
ncbi:transcription initiation factor TFIID subunit 7 [Parasteatoda tepidariorum]|uniref:transcription initiation factor TFIID subunit 7 n=1 Tax=Parasteatoda tepidariorum TaxID=114398 RepID=UPI00077F8E58|nr:transcription initiation factor TFIID subunit 7 [Parasteatoda tepidariorum]